MKTTEPKFETKHIKHTFTPEERNQIGADLARAIAEKRGVEAEFDQVKATYKAKITEKDARIDSLSTSLMNGFDMRNERCVVVFRPADRKKDFYVVDRMMKVAGEPDLEATVSNIMPDNTEDMTNEDFQAELLQAESKFDKKEEIELFKPTEMDSGILVVGRFGGKWFSALRVTIGKLKLEERLDSEQRCFKQRQDAVRHAVKRVNEWAKENLKDLAKGFQDQFNQAAESQKDRVE